MSKRDDFIDEHNWEDCKNCEEVKCEKYSGNMICSLDGIKISYIGHVGCSFNIDIK